MSNLSTTVGSRIKRIREQRNMTQVQLCKIAGLYQANLSDIESGKILPSLKTICNICRVTKTSLARFFFGFPENIK